MEELDALLLELTDDNNQPLAESLLKQLHEIKRRAGILFSIVQEGKVGEPEKESRAQVMYRITKL
jgi:hypothetical protein